jgi:hypothetical protein
MQPQDTVPLILLRRGQGWSKIINFSSNPKSPLSKLVVMDDRSRACYYIFEIQQIIYFGLIQSFAFPYLLINPDRIPAQVRYTSSGLPSPFTA